MKPKPIKTIKKVKAWWIRNGNEGFLLSNVYMNKDNAELVCKGRNLPNNGNIIHENKVIPCTISYSLPVSKTSKK